MTPAAPTTKSPKPAPNPAAPPAPPPLPPEWPIETFIKSIGKLPATLATLLNHLAKLPLIGPVVRLFSSVWFGIAILVLIGAYIAIGSGRPDWRAKLEMTDLQFFDAWPMRVLLVLLVTDLTIVTLRRIPLTLFKLGSWTVHIGIVTLIAGAVWYFWNKEEGSVRIYLHQSVNYVYDTTERALYVFPIKPDGTFDVDHPTILPIPDLPIYYEHLADNGKPLDLALPEIPDMPLKFRVTGYYPSAILMPKGYEPGMPGQRGVGPGLQITVTRPSDNLGSQWLLANPPAKRVLEGDLPMGIEYLRHPDPLRVKDLQTSFPGGASGSLAITVRIPKLGIDRTYLVKPNESIAIEGSNYTLTPVDYQQMPMVSKGYEGATSTMLSVDVARKDGVGGDATFKFQRMCVFRYPERSPDFVTENGKQVRKQDGVDPDLQIVFHDASQTQAWIVEADNDALSLIVRTPDGQSTTRPLADKPLPIAIPALPGGPLSLAVTRRSQNTQVKMLPEIIPPEQRPLHLTAMEAMQLSIVDLEIVQGGTTQPHVYVSFSPYAAIGDPPVGQQPTIVDLPGGKKVGLLLATARRPLPTTLTLTDFKPVKYAGAQRTYADYISTLSAQDAGDAPHTLIAHLNSPAEDHGLYYFQAAWDGDDNAPPEKRFSVIGVANRPGIPVMVLGAGLIILGVAFAFYIKPMLLKAKKESLARWAAQRA